MRKTTKWLGAMLGVVMLTSAATVAQAEGLGGAVEKVRRATVTVTAEAVRPERDKTPRNGSCSGGNFTKCYGIVQYCVPVDWNGQQCAPSYQCGWCFGWW